MRYRLDTICNGRTDWWTDGHRVNIEDLGAILDMIMMYFEVLFRLKCVR